MFIGQFSLNLKFAPHSIVLEKFVIGSKLSQFITAFTCNYFNCMCCMAASMVKGFSKEKVYYPIVTYTHNTRPKVNGYYYVEFGVKCLKEQDHKTCVTQ